MSVNILIGDVRERLSQLPADSFDCCVTSPPYWGLRNYDVSGQLGLEPTLGEHLAVMVEVFEAVKRVLKPEGTLWINYGDCYATTPNGRSAAATKAAGADDRTFRDKPFATIGAIEVPREPSMFDDVPERRGRSENLGNTAGDGVRRNKVGGMLKPKDLCMVPNRLAIALQDAGWWVRSENIWGKLNPMPDSSGRYRPSSAHEKVWHLTKSAKSYYNAEAVRMPVSGGANARKSADPRATPSLGPKTAEPGSGIRSNSSLNLAIREMVETRYLRQWEPDLSPIIPPEVWPMAIRPFKGAHFATFPPELVVPCILAGSPPGGNILDPFGGAGTTGLVAQALGRTATLIELNPDYAAIAERRIIHGNVGLAMPDYEGGPR